MANILYAEDEEKLRRLVADYLRKNEFIVTEAIDGSDALEKFDQDEYNLVILDIMMPKRNGYEVCREIRETSNVPIVILTARDGELDELKGFDYGADEYIAKPFPLSILLARIKSLLKRTEQVLEKPLQLQELMIYPQERKVIWQGKPLMLTPKEFDLLFYLCNNQRIALSREQILDKVWGMDYFGDARTVDTHIKCLRAKLLEFGDCIKTIRKYGYKLEVPNET